MLGHENDLKTDEQSCVIGMTRKEFVVKLLTRAAAAGAILALATEISQNALPPALASLTSSTTGT